MGGRLAPWRTAAWPLVTWCPPALTAAVQERADRQERLQELLRERQQHLSRLVAEEQSMLRVQQEQEALIAQLSDIRGGLQ
jgi:hypothetical protein